MTIPVYLAHVAPKRAATVCILIFSFSPSLIHCQEPPARISDTALVLCLYNNVTGDYGDSSREPKVPYQTLWFTYLDGKVSLRAKFPTCVVPRKDGWWQVQVQRAQGREPHMDVPWAEPLGVAPKISPSESECGGSVNRFIAFVAPEFVGIYEYSNNSCGRNGESENSYLVQLDVRDGMANEAAWTGLATIDPASLGTCDNLGTKKARTTCRENFPAFPKREKGHWSPVSFRLTGYDTLTPTWDLIERQIPLAYDALSSPDKHLLVVLTDRAIRFYSARDLNKPLAEFPQWARTGILSAQWASMKYVAKWEADLGEASLKMRAVNAELEPVQEAKFRQVESKLASEIDARLPAVPLGEWLRDKFPGKQFFWDYGTCATFPEYHKPTCASVQFSIEDGRSVRISFDAGSLEDAHPPKFLAGFVELGRSWLDFDSLADLPKVLADKFRTR